jgi:hypothetical protein
MSEVDIAARNRAYAAKWRTTDAYRAWLERSKDQRKEYKREARRRKGRPSREDQQAARMERQRTERLMRAHFNALRVIAEHRCEYRGWTDAEEYAHRYRWDVAFNLKERVRTSLRRTAKRYSWVPQRFGSASRGRTVHRRLWNVLGYTADELKVHIERQFAKGMDWHAVLAGKIHIDHIVPVSAFDIDSEDEVRACYALSNLRPLWAKDNVRKHARRDVLL